MSSLMLIGAYHRLSADRQIWAMKIGISYYDRGLSSLEERSGELVGGSRRSCR
ncbi:MAG: hypothetical protein QM576_13165 [Rhodopseudomonas sp.]|uniref:hypothetical protein n=1 Tax=Rhodopseudomonas sp. TaxID=1078 RepID=UPI0039E666E5